LLSAALIEPKRENQEFNKANQREKQKKEQEILRVCFVVKAKRVALKAKGPLCVL
jgi:hypothetical protein